jgi:hypothetical protein
MYLLQYRHLEEREGREGGEGGEGGGEKRGTCLKSDKRRRQVVYRLIKVGSSGETSLGGSLSTGWLKSLVKKSK